MKDVARLAGVSIATVSAVINDTPIVSPKRGQRVRQAIEALDYHPDAMARGLRTGKTLFAGVVIPDITNPFFSDLVRGAEDAALRQQYSVIVCDTNEDPLQEQRHLTGLLSRRADGLLISCSKHTGSYDIVLRRHLPVVFLEHLPNHISMPLVATGNCAGAAAATQHLIDLGHHRIAILARNPELLAHAERIEGFRRAMQQGGLPVRDEYFRIGGAGETDGYVFGLEMLRLKRPPTAVFSANNKMLAGLLRAMNELDVLCPRQMSVVGFDDHIWLRAYRPPITTVSQQSYNVGHLAMDMLLTRLAEKPLDSDQVTLPCELIVRSSTAPPDL
jgi:LacI family transcriptional regulator